MTFETQATIQPSNPGPQDHFKSVDGSQEPQASLQHCERLKYGQLCFRPVVFQPDSPRPPIISVPTAARSKNSPERILTKNSKSLGKN